MDDRRSRGSSRGWQIGRHGVLVAVGAAVLFPVYVTVVAALKPGEGILDRPFLPGPISMDGLIDAWTEGRMGRYVGNSILVATIVTAGQLVTSVLSAYAFAFVRFPLRSLVFVAFLATLLVPLESTLAVNRRTVESWGWLDSYPGLVIPFLATALGTLVLRQVFLRLPVELRESAEMEGIGHLGFLWSVALPLVRPTLVALGLVTFLSTWNHYLWPRLIISDENMHTVQSGLARWATETSDTAGVQPFAAATVLAWAPILIVTVVFQRRLVIGLGLTTGGDRAERSTRRTRRSTSSRDLPSR